MQNNVYNKYNSNPEMLAAGKIFKYIFRCAKTVVV